MCIVQLKPIERNICFEVGFRGIVVDFCKEMIATRECTLCLICCLNRNRTSSGGAKVCPSGVV